MRTPEGDYQTKDTGEALALAVCSVREVDERFIRQTERAQEWTFTFDDTEQRQTVSDAFFAAGREDRRDLRETVREWVEMGESVTWERVAAIINLFVRERKALHKESHNFPRR